MNFDKVNSIITLIANVGVVLGLVFLGIEIQLSRAATEATARLARANEIQESNQNFALSDYLPEIYEKLETQGLESLDPVEVRRLKSWETARAGRMYSQVQQAELGFLPEEIRIGTLNSAANNYLPLWQSLNISLNRGFLEQISNRALDQR